MSRLFSPFSSTQTTRTHRNTSNQQDIITTPLLTTVTQGLWWVLWLMGVEYLVLWWQGERLPHLHDNILSLTHATFYEVSKLLVRGLEYGTYTWVWQHYGLLPTPEDSIMTAIILIILIDLCFYWFHRATHEIMVLWAIHQVHHSSQDFTVAVGLRHSPLQRLFSWVFYLPLAVLGVPPAYMLSHIQFNLLYQCWIHTEAISTLGPLEYIFNTPNHHRVHHGCNMYCLDKNYGGIFIVWDHLFSTFQPYKKDVQLVYGIVNQPESFNLLYHQAALSRAEEFKLPTFTYNINSWFSHVDALWPKDYSDEKKYRSLLLALPTDAVCLLQALHTTPTNGTSYESAKASLLQALGKPKQLYLSELDNLQARGRHPSLLLSHIRSLAIAAGTPFLDELLRHRVLQLMPPQLRLHLVNIFATATATLQEFITNADILHDAYMSTISTAITSTIHPTLHHLPHLSDPNVSTVINECTNIPSSDSVMSANRVNMDTVNTVKQGNRANSELISALPQVIDTVLRRLENMERRFSAHSNIRAPSNVHKFSAPSSVTLQKFSPPSKVHNFNTNYKQQWFSGPQVCYYYWRFGNEAMKCTQPC
ncbi:hypothetical protein Pcinc_021629 [Petrolisthes cinctipes]|uniref:Fatty acid hydroxylase domain-containing protein n=1 Tax=Petrolisthes cinctipes TaxID=88211 RepID=A0AAE1FH04_PETCI|nr:hypothetical protein Pcinc_021629 [Petrolisthes cinctipes]